MSDFWLFIKDFLINSIADPDRAGLAWQAKSLDEYLDINRSLASEQNSINPTYQFKLFSPWDNEIYSVLPYQNPTVKELVTELKFKNNGTATIAAANIIVIAIKELMKIQNIDVMIIVPALASKARQREKGFDQCLNIAWHLTKFNNEVGFEVVHLLKRKSPFWNKTAEQHRSARQERFANVRSVLYVDRKLLNTCATKYIKTTQPARRTGIIIFDDVVTTGSTLSAGMKVVEEACAKIPMMHVPIFGLALAH